MQIYRSMNWNIISKQNIFLPNITTEKIVSLYILTICNIKGPRKRKYENISKEGKTKRNPLQNFLIYCDMLCGQSRPKIYSPPNVANKNTWARFWEIKVMAIRDLWRNSETCHRVLYRSFHVLLMSDWNFFVETHFCAMSHTVLHTCDAHVPTWIQSCEDTHKFIVGLYTWHV